MKKRIIAFIMIGVLCLGLLSGCGKDSPTGGESKEGKEDKTKKEQVFSFSTLDEPTGLNPMLNTTEPDYSVQRLFLEGLISYVSGEDGNAVVKPGIAEDWNVSDDGTVYTFKIREDAIWNDDVPVTADDFVYTFKMMATSEIGSTNAWLFDDIIFNFTEAHYDEGKKPEDIGVKAIDEKTIEFTLTKPCAYFVQLLDRAKPVREDKYEEWGEEYGSSKDKIITNGIFKIEEWQPNVQMIFVKNDKYWDAENVKLGKINRYIVEEPAASIQSFLTEKTDVVGTSDPDWQGEIEQLGDKFEKIEVVENNPEFYGFNCSNKYFKNPKIRLAFSMAIDREKYNEELNHGASIPIYSLIPEVINCGEKLYTDLIEEDMDILKSLQKEHKDPKKLLIEGLKEEGLDPDPSKMEIRYATRGTAEYSKKSAEWLLQEWKEKLGVNITIDMMEWNIMWDKVEEGDYDICTAGWTPDYNDPNALLDIYDPVKGYFDSAKSGWDGEDADKYHELLEKASTSNDDKERAELFFEAEKLLVGTGVIAPTYCGKSTAYLAKHVKNYYICPNAGVDYTKIYIE
ncbi:MAG: peptide ABC transporter substrate-binding protein [Clostridiaceae bacterium]|nr:peptide ABC transporter substrate-binding protein [Clostridiaceae bacterium]MBW4860598.1 peptide ABC transporter substrate-binding protein [Clostridiaceae bacterium]MBW4868514.1 peptide ABC transporter substrate-binding protein [Clostridiaceae bacterium]